MAHPLSIPEARNNGGTNKHGQRMKGGDRVRDPFTGKCGVADEFLQDGDTYISFDDGSHGTVKWYHLEPTINDGEMRYGRRPSRSRNVLAIVFSRMGSMVGNILQGASQATWGGKAKIVSCY